MWSSSSSSTATFALLNLLVLIFVVASSAKETPVPDCTLQCQHSVAGCQLPSDEDNYPHKFQSGSWLPTCGECEYGWGGIGCEIPVVECDEAGRCPGTEQCIEMRDGTRRCADCALAERVSRFAGNQCQRPYTEYCEGSWDDFRMNPIFCTNGGKCSYNNDRVFLKCSCPPEFDGPHCEYLQLPEDGGWKDPLHPQLLLGEDRSGMHPMGKLAVSLLVLFALTVAALYIRKRRRNRNATLSNAFHDFSAPNLWLPDEGKHDAIPDDSVAAHSPASTVGGEKFVIPVEGSSSSMKMV